MSDKSGINNNIETGGFWTAWVWVIIIFSDYGDNDFDLYDLVYQLLLKKIGN